MNKRSFAGVRADSCSGRQYAYQSDAGEQDPAASRSEYADDLCKKMEQFNEELLNYYNTAENCLQTY